MLSYQILKIRTMASQLFHADGHVDEQKDMTKLMVGFRNFANPPKMKIS